MLTFIILVSHYYSVKGFWKNFYDIYNRLNTPTFTTQGIKNNYIGIFTCSLNVPFVLPSFVRLQGKAIVGNIKYKKGLNKFVC